MNISEFDALILKTLLILQCYDKKITFLRIYQSISIFHFFHFFPALGSRLDFIENDLSL